MTPNDIATSVSGLRPVESGNVAASTNFTQSPAPFGGFTMDDANTWD